MIHLEEKQGYKYYNKKEQTIALEVFNAIESDWKLITNEEAIEISNLINKDEESFENLKEEEMNED